MFFRRLIVAALLVGCVAGLVLSFIQVISVNPIIFSAEVFESNVAHHHDGGDHHGEHIHSGESWSPKDGAERTGFTVTANVFAGIGFAAIILALMSQLQQLGATRVSTLKGVVWGGAGFLVFFVAPGIGLPPEIPGVEAALVENRQVWWVFAVCSVGVGALILGFVPLKYKIVGVVFAVLPYIVAIPRHEGSVFTHSDIHVVATLTELHQQFIVASGASNFVFWLVLGVGSAWILNAWVLKNIALNRTYGTPVNV